MKGNFWFMGSNFGDGLAMDSRIATGISIDCNLRKKGASSKEKYRYKYNFTHIEIVWKLKKTVCHSRGGGNPALVNPVRDDTNKALQYIHLSTVLTELVNGLDTRLRGYDKSFHTARLRGYDKSFHTACLRRNDKSYYPSSISSGHTQIAPY
ncbi:MAG: hypothetical protein RBS43_06040 [Candidatus Cloacimonas sp.]|nr:hypothetical protein [Candidatus Cloacimonas sp.]